MITLVSSPKQHLPKDMQHSVHNKWIDKFCTDIMIYDTFSLMQDSKWVSKKLWLTDKTIWRQNFWIRI